MKFDPVQTQQDLVGALASSPQFADVAVKSYRKMVTESELDYRTILTGRNGRTGSGVLVAMPEAKGRTPNVSGPVLDWTFPIVCLEQPVVNLHPVNGTLLTAEELAQRVLDVLHLWADEKTGTFQTEGSAVSPEKEFVFPGTVGYRVSFHLTGKNSQTARCRPVSAVSAGGEATLACAEPGALIFYTLDGTFPTSPEGGNPGSLLYSGPVPLVAGQPLRAVAYAEGKNNSAASYLAPA